ncbi:MAG: hypothetical protein HOG95_03475, partial [Rhodospirillaceae bacterium]|nr:hypothetical protein [Rhodospirillaceae bacterium]
MKNNVKATYRCLFRTGLIGVAVLSLSACNTFTRLSEIGKGPKTSEIVNPVKRPDYR